LVCRQLYEPGRPLGWFTSERLGFNMAWLATAYLTFQLIAVPFSIPTSANPQGAESPLNFEIFISSDAFYNSTLFHKQ
jgi:hypothetical protein